MRISIWTGLACGCLAAGLLDAATIYVSVNGDDASGGDSWATAKRTIQAGVNAAVGDDVVMISNGVYVLTNSVRIDHYIGELRSLNGRNVIIDGNSSVRCLLAEKNVTVRGLTFRNGNSDQAGGGLLFYDGGLVADCTVISNRAASSGGGIYGTVSVSNCVVAGNRATYGGGGMELGASSKGETLYVVDSIVSNNILEQTDPEGICEGGGIRISQDTDGAANIINCRIVNNVAQGGPVYSCLGGGLHVNYARALTVRNTLIAGNSCGGYGGGASINNGTALENCTVAGNASEVRGSGLYVTNPGSFTTRVENTVCFSNYVRQGTDNWGDDATVLPEGCPNVWFENCCLRMRFVQQLGLRGTNNLTSDPRYLNGASEAWRLSSVSPCINAGTNRPWMEGARDLDRYARILNEIVDIGCYETDPSGVSIDCFMVKPSEGQAFAAPADIDIQAFGYSLKPLAVTQLVVYANGAVVATSRNDEIATAWSNVWGGSYSLSCQVWNEKGHTAISEPVSVTVSGPSCRRHVVNDFDGDGRSDLAIYRQDGYWWVAYMAGGGFQGLFGGSSCQPVEGDFDGDGIADRAIYQEASGYWGFSMSGSADPLYTLFGAAGFRPVRGDFDGDGRSDAAVYRAASGYWFYRPSGSPDVMYNFAQFGGPAYTPAEGDFDGDGRTDFGVFHAQSGTWYVQLSASGSSGGLSFGLPGCVAVPGDYDLDYKTDFVVFSPSAGLWVACLSASGYSPAYSMFTPSGGLPVRGDFDGDGRADLLTYTEPSGLWQGYLTSTGWVGGTFGGSGWSPVQ
jgi:parallel beta-helix repeat protein